MSRRHPSRRGSWLRADRFFLASTIVFGFVFAGCGGGSSGTGSPVGPTPAPTGSNVQSVVINSGPAPTTAAATDLLYTSVTVCVPGSTSQCQTISNVQVDTGSSGLRILASVLTIPLTQQQDSSGNPIGECEEFEDGETWGPVQIADIGMAGEKASAQPVQVIGGGTGTVASVPAACSNQGPVEDDVDSLEANGIIGVGNFIQDCGEGCAVSGAQNPGLYYTCPTTGCAVFAEPLANQVSNPVAFFATDNNGVVIQLPSASAPEGTLTGSMTFGIGTQSNNGIGSATVYTIDPNFGTFTTTFNGTAFTSNAFLDSGSNGYYFPDSSLAACTDLPFWYCPASTQNLTATNQGLNGATGTVNFSIGNADTLTATVSNAVVPNLGGPNTTGQFDWGLPFFFGRTVFVAIEGKSTPSGQGPYWAY